MAARLATQSDHRGPATASGRLFSLGGYPGFVVGPAGETHGDLLRMHDAVATLIWLDDYEECGPLHPPPHEYRRERLLVAGTQGAVEAWVYVYAGATHGLSEIVGGDFLACTGRGAG